MHMWAGGPGVHTFACISEINADSLYCNCSFHWPKEEGMSQNSILIVFFVQHFSKKYHLEDQKLCFADTEHKKPVFSSFNYTFLKFHHRT